MILFYQLFIIFLLLPLRPQSDCCKKISVSMTVNRPNKIKKKKDRSNFNNILDDHTTSAGITIIDTTTRKSIVNGTMTDSSLHPNLVISPSQKVHHLLFSRMRNKFTPSKDFVQYSKRAMRLLAEDALAEFPSQSVEIITPCGSFDGVEGPDPERIVAVSIMRSGDALLDVVRDIEPAVRVGKILIQRDESTIEKKAKLFYCKVPSDIARQNVLLCDPMLATGGSAIEALNVLVGQHGVPPSKIIFANMICAPEGLKILADTYPEVKIVTAVIDKNLNDEKFIVPGLGDYGDRFYNSL